MSPSEHKGWATQQLGCSSQLFIILFLIKFISDEPLCKFQRVKVYPAAINDDVSVTCEVEADPDEVSFHWKVNSTVNSDSDIKVVSSKGSKSVINFIPSSRQSYGSILCWGENFVGKQKDPCHFKIIPAGKRVCDFSSYAIIIQCSISLNPKP